MKKLFIIAHRGASKQAPENTLPSFELALRSKPDMVELDYHMSEDGEFIVIHDHCLDRTTDAATKWKTSDIAVNARMLKEIKTLDAGSWFHWGKSEFCGAEVPTLKEAMNIIQESSFTLIERKAGEPEELIRFLETNGWLETSIVQSFDWDFIEKMHAINAKIQLGCLGAPKESKEQFLNAEFIEDIAKRGARYIGWNKNVTADSIALAHKKGLQVLVYTINDPDQAEQLVALGVDGIITDDPETMAKRLRK
jgi:glycerophosphoryl diester phosphodiesterase